MPCTSSPTSVRATHQRQLLHAVVDGPQGRVGWQHALELLRLLLSAAHLNAPQRSIHEGHQSLQVGVDVHEVCLGGIHVCGGKGGAALRDMLWMWTEAGVEVCDCHGV